MSIRRQTSAHNRGFLASVFAFLSTRQSVVGIAFCFGSVVTPLGCLDAFSQSDTTGTNTAPTSTPAAPISVITTRTNRPTNRPRPSFWQGDNSLTEDQLSAIRDLNQVFRKENKPLLDLVTQLNRELEEAVFANPPDKTVIQAKASELGSAEGKLAIARSQLIAKLRPKLSSEQLERLKSLRGSYELAERFAAVPSTTNRSAGVSRPRKREAESDASGSPKPKE